MFIQKYAFLTIIVIIILGFSSCVENGTDPDLIADFDGDWLMTNIREDYDDNTYWASSPDDADYHVFLQMFDDESYKYVIIDKALLIDGIGNWRAWDNKLKFYDFNGQDIEGTFSMSNQQFSFITSDFNRENMTSTTWLFTYDRINVDPALAGLWDLTRIDSIRGTDTNSYSVLDVQIDEVYEFNAGGDFFNQTRPRNGGSWSTVSGSWDYAFNILRLYNNDGLLSYYKYDSDGYELMLIRRKWHRDIEDYITSIKYFRRR